MELDLTAAMADFIAKGGAVTTLDYAGNAVGQHQDIDLDEPRTLLIQEKTTRKATPKNAFVNRSADPAPMVRPAPAPAPLAKAAAPVAVLPVERDALSELRAIRKRAGILLGKLSQIHARVHR